MQKNSVNQHFCTLYSYPSRKEDIIEFMELVLRKFAAKKQFKSSYFWQLFLKSLLVSIVVVSELEYGYS